MMSDCRKCADFEWCNEHEECGLFKPKKMTNADGVRSMTNEELADFIYNHSCAYCPMDDCDGRMEIGRDACYKRWLDWLRQEVNDG